MRLMIDANHGYDALEACEVGRKAAASLGVDWFEEPVVPEQLGAYRAVRAGQPIPVAGGETWHSRWGMREVLETRAVDIIQPDIAASAASPKCARVADMASLHGVRVVPHVWGTGVAHRRGPAVHGGEIPDPIRRNPSSRSWNSTARRTLTVRRCVTAPIEHRNGVVAIPDGPGLGIEINREALAQFALKDD